MKLVLRVRYIFNEKLFPPQEEFKIPLSIDRGSKLVSFLSHYIWPESYDFCFTWAAVFSTTKKKKTKPKTVV